MKINNLLALSVVAVALQGTVHGNSVCSPIGIPPHDVSFFTTEGLNYYGYDKSRTAEVSYTNNKISGNVKIPNSVEHNGISYKVTSIGWDAFANCTGLTNITVSPDNPNYSTEDGVLFNKDKTRLIRYPAGKDGSTYVIPDGVTSIGSYAFKNCTGLTDIVIPHGVTSIGYCAFANCTGLTDIVIPHGVTSIGSDAFRNCTGLTDIVIPDGVTVIGDGAFANCTRLSSVYYKGNVVPSRTGISIITGSSGGSKTTGGTGGGGSKGGGVCTPSGGGSSYPLCVFPELFSRYTEPLEIYSGTPETLTSYYPRGNKNWEKAIVKGKWRGRKALPWDPPAKK